MDKNKTPEKLAIDISGRSSCSVQVGAVITDRKGRLVSWGWNNTGLDGFGRCAEHSAIMRSNPKRLKDSIIYVAGFRAKNSNPVTSKPCRECQKIIAWAGISQAHYLTNSNEWKGLY